MNEEQGKVSKKDLFKVYVRTMFGLQWGWNYEKMQGLGYCYSILPVLKKLYPKKEDLAKAMKIHLGFFNTATVMSHLIIGANIAIEEEFGNQDEEAITGLKTGLMGPFAGVGDTIFLAIYRAIVFSTAAYLALEGQAIGVLIPLVCGAGIMGVRFKFTQIGYTQGRKIATGFASSLRVFTEAASILGITVVGALVPSVVKAPINLNFNLGEVTLSIQEMLDKIMPNLMPLGVVLFSFWLLGKKGMSSTKLIFVLIALGIVIGNLDLIFSVFTF